jgi:hypothetical protein
MFNKKAAPEPFKVLDCGALPEDQLDAGSTINRLLVVAGLKRNLRGEFT